jgi:hypothetical protein
MIDADTLEAILDEHEPDTHTELLALCAAKARLREGADPAVVLAVTEGSRDMAAFEREYGLAATFDRVRELARHARAEPADND